MEKSNILIIGIIIVFMLVFGVIIGYYWKTFENIEKDYETDENDSYDSPFISPIYSFTTIDKEHIDVYVSEWNLVEAIYINGSFAVYYEDGTYQQKNFSILEGHYYDTTFLTINDNLTEGHCFNKVCYVPKEVFTNPNKLPNYVKHRIYYTIEKDGVWRIYDVDDGFFENIKIKILQE